MRRNRYRLGTEKEKRKNRSIARGPISADYAETELHKKTNPTALKQTAIFVCALAVFGIGFVFIVSMLWGTTEFMWKTIVPIIAAAVCVGVSLIRAILPDYFIYEKRQVRILVYAKMLELRRQEHTARVFINKDLRIVYQENKKKLCIYGDVNICRASREEQQEWHNAKISLFMEKEAAEKLRQYLQGTEVNIW